MQRIVYILCLTSLLSGLCWIPAAVASVIALGSPDELKTITEGEYILRYQKEETYRFRLSRTDLMLLKIEDLGLDSNLRVLDVAGRILLSARSWDVRGGHYLLLLDKNLPQECVLEVQRYNSNGREASVHLKVEAINELSDISLARVLKSISMAYNLRDSYKQENKPYDNTVIDAFASAAKLSESIYRIDYQALMLFELGVVLLELGNPATELPDTLVIERKNLYERARRELGFAAVYYERLGDLRGRAAALNARGRSEHELDYLNEALKTYEAAAAIEMDLNDLGLHGIILSNKGMVQRDMLNSEGARADFEGALQIFQCGDANPKDVKTYVEQVQVCGYLNAAMKALSNLALVHDYNGEGDAAEEYWRVCVELMLVAGDESALARVRQNLGGLYVKQGRYNEAFSTLSTVVDFFEKKPDDEWLSLALANLGRIDAEIGNHHDAVKFYLRGLDLKGITPRRRAMLWRNLGESYLVIDSIKAIDAFKAALEYLKDNRDPAIQISTLSAYGLALAAQGRMAEAFSKQEEAYNLAQISGAVRSEGRILSRLAALKISQGRLKEARADLTNALEKHRNSGDDVTQLETLERLIQVEVGLALSTSARSAEPQLLMPAIHYAQEATDLADQLRVRAVAPQQRSQFLASRRQVYEWYIWLLMGNGQQEEAWRISERTRARSLVDLLDERALAQTDANVHVSNREVTMQRLRLARKMSFLAAEIENNEIHNPSADQPLRGLQKRMDELRNQYKRLETQHGATHLLQLDLTKLQQQLGPSRLVLSYFLGAKNSYLWAIDQHQMRSFTLGSSYCAERLVRDCITTVAETLIAKLSVSDSSSDQIGVRTEALSQLLLPDALDLSEYQSLIIMPDGILHRIPFGLLPYRGKELLVSHQLSYVGSAAIWDLLRQRQPARGEGVIVLANPTVKRQPTNVSVSILNENDTPFKFNLNTTLGSSQLEGERIADLVRDEPSVLLSGNDANYEFIIEGKLSPYRVLHFATHGQVSESIPELSGLMLAAPPDQSTTGYIRASEIASLDLSADLVVLSSCQTGVGKAVDGEGLLSLIQPFFIAGAGQVIASLWQVGDAATAELMPHFYQNYLNEGMSVSEALRRAQEWMRNQETWRHPNHWAGFIVQGEDLSERVSVSSE